MTSLKTDISSPSYSTCISFVLLVLLTAAFLLVFRTFTDGYDGPQSLQLVHVPHHKLNMIAANIPSSKPSDSLNCHILHKANSCNSLPNYFMYPSQRPQFKNAFINFMHIPKSGGTTMKECMIDVTAKLQIAEPFLLHSEGRLQVTQDVLNGNFHFLNSTFLFMGDYSFGFCDLIHDLIGERKCSTFVILREPYERMVSDYYYCIELNETAFELDCRNHSIIEWALYTKSILWNELFTDIDCYKNDTWKCVMDYAHLITKAYPLSQNGSFIKSVVANLDKHFSMIGLVEDMPTFLKMLQVAYNIPFFKTCQKIHYNTGTYHKPANLSLSKVQTRKKAKRVLLNNPDIRKMLHPEMLIYKRAKQIFEIEKNELNKLLISKSKQR